MMNTIDYLKDAQLVADFQNFFGIQLIVLDEQNNGQISKHNLDNDGGSLKQWHLEVFKNGDKPETNGILKKEFTNDQSNNLSVKSTRVNHKKNYVIKNLVFYYIFCFGASLGYETFYALFFPFFLHSIDSFVARRIIFIWAITMYIGQSLKDIIKWNRPKSPPVVVLEPEYSLEYGMPSTHAMVGFLLPFSIFIFTQSRYAYPFWIGFTLASIWCFLVCSSRLYLGMHTVLDVLVGLLLSAAILFIIVPAIDLIDEFNLKNPIAPFLALIIVCLMSIYYPKSDRWSPARGDTCVMVGFSLGVLIGSWINYQLDMMTDPTLPTLFQIHLPTKWAILLMLVRTIIHTLSIELIRLLGKKLLYPFLCKIQNLNPKDPESKKVPGVEVPLKLTAYIIIGIILTHLIPILFKYLRI